MSKTTKYKIEIKPLNLEPEQVADLLHARRKGNLKLTIPVNIESVSSGVDGHQLDLGLMVREELTIDMLINGQDGGLDGEVRTLECYRENDQKVIDELSKKLSDQERQMESWQKAITAERNDCERGYDAIDWPFPSEWLPENMPAMVRELVRQLELLRHSVEPWTHNDLGYIEAGDHTPVYPNTLNIEAPANLARAIACVNALADVDIELLKKLRESVKEWKKTHDGEIGLDQYIVATAVGMFDA